MAKEPYKLEQHRFHLDCKIAGKQYCIDCGLIRLNNDFTRWALDKGCNYKDHQDLERKRKLTNTFLV